MSPQTWDSVGLGIGATLFAIALIAVPDLTVWFFSWLIGVR